MKRRLPDTLARDIERVRRRYNDHVRKQFPNRKPTALTHSREADELELLLYGVIGGDFWNDGISADDVVTLLRDHKDASRLNVRINSPGGSVWEGAAIYNALVQHPGHVRIQIDGEACSMASVVAMSGDEIVMGQATTLMIHRAWTIVAGNGPELRLVADVLESIDEQIVQIYAERTELATDAVLAMLDEETYFTAQEALDAGFADEVLPAKTKPGQSKKSGKKASRPEKPDWKGILESIAAHTRSTVIDLGDIHERISAHRQRVAN